ncbi:unnamed protein product [Mycena citricolor]|uniref:FYVE-type domain-containing protein n=1 Tax=Mycena citricolor TaxID=2018698 RepID=A0AAD2GX72_9AGAR|nr:unnamed protein product [Mycena citricolor]
MSSAPPYASRLLDLPIRLTVWLSMISLSSSSSSLSDVASSSSVTRSSSPVIKRDALSSSATSMLSTLPSSSSLSSDSARDSICTRASLSSSAASFESGSVASIRCGEHLAILLPKRLWKVDSESTYCDSLPCRVPFTLFERRHHCRKCGGVFCRACTSQTTPLLDTAALPEPTIPEDTAVSDLASPESPVVQCRVCMDCYNQVLGRRTPDDEYERMLCERPRRSSSLLASPISLFKVPAFVTQSAPSSPPQIPAALPSVHRRSLARAASPRRRTRLPSLPVPERSLSPLRTDSLPCTGLSAYPLSLPSAICKAAGGGRWAPELFVSDPMRRPLVLGSRAPWETQYEQAKEEERQRRRSVVVHVKLGEDEIRYRVWGQDHADEYAPESFERPRLALATF